MPSFVFEDQAQLGLEREVRADEDAAERVGIVAVKRLAVLTVVAGLQADVVRARPIRRHAQDG